MGKKLNLVGNLHNQTKRDCLARMNDDKVNCMIKARKFDFDFWDGERKFGYGGHKYIPGRWTSVAQDLICKKNPDLFNQAIIEYGAMICKPKNPICTNCIFNYECKALKKNKVYELPRKKNNKTLAPPIKEKTTAYILKSELKYI